MIIKLTKNHPNISGTFSNEQLAALINSTIQKTFSELENMLKVKNTVSDDNPDKTEEYLDIQITKLWSWKVHQGIAAIGGKKKNRSSDIRNW